MKRIALLLIGAATLSACFTSDFDVAAASSDASDSVFTPPSEWETLDDVTESINAVTDACPEIHTDTDLGVAGCAAPG